jgi:hypothetical protein
VVKVVGVVIPLRWQLLSNPLRWKALIGEGGSLPTNDAGVNRLGAWGFVTVGIRAWVNKCGHSSS